jgi:predicted cupin superfamily sugar epimerase
VSAEQSKTNLYSLYQPATPLLNLLNEKTDKLYPKQWIKYSYLHKIQKHIGTKNHLAAWCWLKMTNRCIKIDPREPVHQHHEIDQTIGWLIERENHMKSHVNSCWHTNTRTESSYSWITQQGTTGSTVYLGCILQHGTLSDGIIRKFLENWKQPNVVSLQAHRTISTAQ